MPLDPVMRTLHFPPTSIAPKTPHELYQVLPPPPRSETEASESARYSNVVCPLEIEMPYADADADVAVDVDASADTDASVSAGTPSDEITPTVRRSICMFGATSPDTEPGSPGTWPPCEVAGFLRTVKTEDRYAHLRTCIGGEQVQLALVVDGHGGAVAARACKEQLLTRVAEAAGDDASAASLSDAASAAFKEMHMHLRSTKNGPTDGCAATVVAVNETRRVVVCANVGDCFAIAVPGRREGADAAAPFEVLTTNDRLEANPAEVERARAAGCVVGHALDAKRNPYGPLRAWPGGLTCARALGDADIDPWLIPDPHVFAAEYGAGSHFCIVIASDGVWDAIEPAVVAAVVRHTPGVQKCVEAVVNKATNSQHAYATAEWNTPKDDTTAVVIAVGSALKARQLSVSPRKTESWGKQRWRSSLSLWGQKSQRSGTSTSVASNRSVGSLMSERSRDACGAQAMGES